MADSDSSCSSSSKPNPQSSSSKPNPQSSSSKPNPQSSSSKPNPQSSSPEPSSSESTPPSSPSPSPSTSDSHIISIAQQKKFMDSLPEDVTAELQYQLIDLFGLYVKRMMNTAKFELSVLKLIKTYQFTLYEFKKLFPTANLIPFTNEKGKTIFNMEHCHFNDKVRAGLYDETDSYMHWLEHLIEFNHGNETYPEFKRNVESQFVDMADLLIEFQEIFSQYNEDVEAEESKGDSNSDSSDHEPVSKSRKTM